MPELYGAGWKACATRKRKRSPRHSARGPFRRENLLDLLELGGGAIGVLADQLGGGQLGHLGRVGLVADDDLQHLALELVLELELLLHPADGGGDDQGAVL